VVDPLVCAYLLRRHDSPQAPRDVLLLHILLSLRFSAAWPCPRRTPRFAQACYCLMYRGTCLIVP